MENDTAAAQITDLQTARTFTLSGKAVFTVVSARTGMRFTYKVTQHNDKPLHFVKVLTGPDSYSFLGTIFDGQSFGHGKKSPIGQSAPSAVAFRWLWRVLAAEAAKEFELVEFWHEGHCGRCGRSLTDPTSIQTGLGPVCARKE